MQSYFPGIHLFSRRDSRIRWFFSPSFFLIDLLSCYIVRLISIFKMCSWGWGLFSEFGITQKHQASLGAVGLFLPCAFFTESGSTCHHLDFQFRIVLVCLKLRHVNSDELCRLFKFAWLEEKEQWQLIDMGMANEARLKQKPWFPWNHLLCWVLACHQGNQISKWL